MKKILKFLGDNLIILAGAGLFIVLFYTNAWAQKYFVDQEHGDNYNSGLSWEEAKLTILSAMELTEPGDVIAVAAGIYLGPHNINSGITLEGGYPAGGGERDWKINLTILDGAQAGSVVLADNSFGAVLDGVTITNGNNAYGGGITCSNSDLTIKNCYIKENTAKDGAGIHAQNFQGVIEANTIVSNLAQEDGGGIWFKDSTAIIRRNFISRNRARSGAGVYCSGKAKGSGNISGNKIIENQALKNGGGFYFDGYKGKIESNIIQENRTLKGGGGGIYALDYSGRLANNLIAYNSSTIGGGIYAADFLPDSLIINNTVVANSSASGVADGVAAYYLKGKVRNNIFCDNGREDLLTFGNLDITHCLVGGLKKHRNFFLNPRFVNPKAGDFRLLASSPCIDKGVKKNVPTHDLTGKARHQGDGIDIGAYEFGGALQDADRDGYISIKYGGKDCNDRNPRIHPGAREIYNDGKDQNCDGQDSIGIETLEKALMEMNCDVFDVCTQKETLHKLLGQFQNSLNIAQSNSNIAQRKRALARLLDRFKRKFITRINGCDRVETPEPNDWIRECSAQEELLPLAQNLAHSIRTEINR